MGADAREARAGEVGKRYEESAWVRARALQSRRIAASGRAALFERREAERLALVGSADEIDTLTLPRFLKKAF